MWEQNLAILGRSGLSGSGGGKPRVLISIYRALINHTPPLHTTEHEIMPVHVHSSLNDVLI